MGALMIVSFVSMILLGLPTLPYFYAKQMGRNPKKWFVLRFFLPEIATIILSFLPDILEEEKPKDSA